MVMREVFHSQAVHILEGYRNHCMSIPNIFVSMPDPSVTYQTTCNDWTKKAEG